MRENRSTSQILFGYLPGQTVDMRGSVWKVDKWINPLPGVVDETQLRKELERAAYPWGAAGTDGGYVTDLRASYPIDLLTLNVKSGVAVESFPKLWLCRRCGWVKERNDQPCGCGFNSWGQFPFVAYHDCGLLEQPRLARCPTHREVSVKFPGTSSASEIRLECPKCNRLIRKGLAGAKCTCGNGNLRFDVHRASSVYTPRSMVMVNPPRPDQVRDLRAAGGPPRALEWVLSGMVTKDFRSLVPTKASLIAQLTSTGIDAALAEAMANQAVTAGQATDDALGPQAYDGDQSDAASQAVVLATALLDSRTRSGDLAAMSGIEPSIRDRYSVGYPAAIERAGFDSVEFVDKFPVLTGMFGYTRGESSAGTAQLRTFRSGIGRYAVYAEMAETEALLFRLKPSLVASWLVHNDFALDEWTDDRSARVSILKAAQLPLPGDAPPNPVTVGSALLTLVHSFAHRTVRRLSALSGIERTSMSELLVPLHLSFFVYAASKGDFVLGGLQAVFETELDRLMNELVFAEHRCALDPGCEKSGAACAACLHLGEPSCRYFNRFLDRRSLHGATSFMAMVSK